MLQKFHKQSATTDKQLLMDIQQNKHGFNLCHQFALKIK